VPALRRVAVLWNAGNPSFTRVCQLVDAAPGSLGLVLVSDPVREPEDSRPHFRGSRHNGPRGFLFSSDALVAQLGQDRRIRVTRGACLGIDSEAFSRVGRSYVVRAEPDGLTTPRPPITSTGFSKAKAPPRCRSRTRQRSR